MDMKEKLVELVGQVQDCGCDVTDVVQMNYVENTTLVDHLIAHVVTVQEWISVKEQEQPTEYGTYLCHGYWLSSRRKKTETAEFFGEWNLANNFILTHWMPLPQPPKGE